jgi:hypothetical protein
VTLQPLDPSSTTYATDVVGSVTPRLWTPPLRELTEETTYGYELIDFAARIGWPLDPWEQWVAIHAGELLPDGRPRFRIILILVARQNGKTLLSRVWVLWWLFIQEVPLVIGAHADRDKAKTSWQKTIEMALKVPLLARELGRRHTVKQVGEEDFSTLKGAHYRFGAANRRLGRGDTVGALSLDELREHLDWDAYDAALNAMNAVSDGQAVAITNQGDDRAVVLDSLRESALEYIETGAGDRTLGLFEWSAPNGSEPDDLAALAAANPNLGHRIEVDVLMGAAQRAKRRGGEQLARFKTEVLCMRVTLLDPAIDPDRWAACGYDPDDDAQRVDLADHRGQLALCLDVALDGSHATLMAAARVGEHVYVEVVQRWQGFGCTAAVRSELPELVRRLRPRTLGWFPGGPAASVAAALTTRQAGRVWPPPRVAVAELKAETVPVCMGLAEQVATGELRHPRDPMLTGHVEQTQKLRRGDGWIYVRRGSGPIDATYAMAGAVHLARTLPPPLPPLSVA